MGISIELLLLGISVLFFLSLLAGKIGSRLGVPVLLLFLGVGMLCGSDGLGLQFENLHVAQTIGTISLCIILFSGGMDTKVSEIKPILFQGVTLATLGVLLTTGLTGLVVWWVLGMNKESAEIGIVTSLLLAATMSSTDSASVFGILRSKGVHLKNNLKPMLELESGSNDPMAYMLTITLMEVLSSKDSPTIWGIILNIVMQLVIGAGAGFLLGKLAVLFFNHIKIGNKSLYPILTLTFCIFIFSFTYFIKGNGYLAVYISGLVIGNSQFIQKRSSLNFFDGLAWLCQILMFLTLGLLVNPHELIPVAIPGLIIGFFMVFITRPISVFLCLLPFRKMPFRNKLYVSWVGLRGAVPIIFAIMPLVAEIPHARLIFNIVFFITLISLLVQGTSLSMVAKWFRVTDKRKLYKNLEEFDFDFSDDIKSATTEISVNKQLLENGNKLKDLQLPDNTLVIFVKRNKLYFVPTGKTVLHENDKLLIITDDKKALLNVYKNLGIGDFSLKQK